MARGSGVDDDLDCTRVAHDSWRMLNCLILELVELCIGLG